MTAILAIDAAWTKTEPSGVALVASSGDEWRCIAVAPSYAAFLVLASGTCVNWAQSRFPGSPPDIPNLLEAARSLASAPVDLVTIDMPIATTPFSTRRAADDAISKMFGGRWCSAHTPSSIRPGPLGEALSAAFADAGFPIATTATEPPLLKRLIEVYPHPALLALLDRPSRVPYKVSKAGRYWKDSNKAQRISQLLEEFQNIYNALVKIFGPLALPLPAADSVSSLGVLKRYEDALDALVCAWVGVLYMQGAAVALGDDNAAIWCPKDAVKPKC
ncbi:MAG: hypothetical protein QOJ16_185 [Acidobacteriota bacterium]|jgi:predicted RNase H-like nuclease|nr:hypothetical protein [Acidobacteriota bacterium]